MRNICRVYAANGENNFMELDLPATDYEMLDMMERLRLEGGKLPYLEVLKFGEEYGYLERCVHEQPDICVKPLNICSSGILLSRSRYHL